MVVIDSEAWQESPFDLWWNYGAAGKVPKGMRRIHIISSFARTGY